MKRETLTIAGLAAAVVGVVVVAALLEFLRRPDWSEATLTVGDIHAVHAEVRVGDDEVRGRARISDGSAVSTAADGRARVRLDDGTLVVVDSNTKLTISKRDVAVEAGRVFIRGGPHSKVQVKVGDIATSVSSSAAAFARPAGAASKVYCSDGELMLSHGEKQTRVGSGETATLDAKGVSVAPERAFNDWTGGLAVPWEGEGGRVGAVAELRGVAGSIDSGKPLVVRAQHIDTVIDGEVAVTRAKTSYFNGSDRSVRADLRMAIPPGAILSKVQRRTGTRETSANLRIGRTSSGSSSAGLEWAGDGQLRGHLGQVASGKTVELLLEYTEWLDARGSRATYRFPMATDADPPLIGKLQARVDARGTRTPWMTGSSGAVVRGGVLEIHQADVRATGDLAVELAPKVLREGEARAYLTAALPNEDPYLMVRTEVPARQDPGITLAVVLDTSMSVGASTLETERAVLDAILEGLGPRDSIVVLAADQGVSSVGPKAPTPVTPKLRQELAKALSQLRPGGASNLALALERAADVLDAPSRGEQAGLGVVVYLGDGRPTVGEPDSVSIKRRLRRRTGGMPRLSAVAVGAGADRWLLARLVTDVGFAYEVNDRADAAQVGAALLADALKPTLREVAIDLGPHVDRVYPRESRAVLAGATVTVIGRLRGELPSKVGFRYRDGTKVVAQELPLRRMRMPRGADIQKRWAAARIAEMAARGDGHEPAVALANEMSLLTPWTGWYFDYGSSGTPFAQRVLELSPTRDAAFARYVEPAPSYSSTLLEPPSFGGGSSLKEAVQAATRRILDKAARSIRACRDARAAVRPEVPNTFRIDISLSSDGEASGIQVIAGETVTSRDPVLERCIEAVVKSLPYLAMGTPVDVSHKLTIPEGRNSQRTKCSPASKVSLPVRRAVWMERGRTARGFNLHHYTSAARSCELPTWTARRELLLLILENQQPAWILQLARDLDAAGEVDAATFVQREALRRVTTFAQLQQLSREILANEPNVDDELEKAYAKAKDDDERLKVVRRFLRLAPHSALARRRLFALLEALGQKDALLTEINQVRSDPFADAGLLAAGASALRRLEQPEESRRAFGELIERAPRDPWTLAFVGDRLRGEGLFDEAVDSYESLARVMPLDAAVSLRLALAHAGAGRLDVATRLLERVSQGTVRVSEAKLGELASIVQAVLLAGAHESASAESKPELGRRLLQTPLPDVASVVLIQSSPGDDPLTVRVARGDEEKDADALPADFDARSLGLVAHRIERGTNSARILIRRPEDPGPSKPLKARVAALVLTDRDQPKLVTRDIEVAADGEAFELRWDGGAFL